MCLDGSIQSFITPKPEIIKAYKVFDNDLRSIYYKDWRENAQFKTEVWIEDQKDFQINQVHSPANYTQYRTGFHAFVDMIDALNYASFENLGIKRELQLQVYEVELTDITAYGYQYFVVMRNQGRTPCQSCPCVVARKMKIGRKVSCA